MPRAVWIALGLAVAAAIAIGVAFIVLKQEFGAPGPLTEDAVVAIPRGTSLAAAADLLAGAGVIASPRRFLLEARLFGTAEPIKAGEYNFAPEVSARAALDKLQRGDVIVYSITIPEGLSAVQVHDLLMAEDRLTGDVDIPEEGSVLPETYSFTTGEERAAVLSRMQAAMREALAALWPNRAPDLPLASPQEAVTLASIVEKETGQAEERPMVAGVFVNRLRSGMRLEADPTVIYPITKGRPLGRRIRLSELRAENDYNTYVIPGLPAGPIANPGRASLEAVLRPAKTDAIFFVADGSGGHLFASTLAEHQRNVRAWRNHRAATGK